MLEKRLVDAQARRITYLRVSLTDRCNFRCQYCMPQSIDFAPRADLLSFEEILKLLTLFAARGVRRVRFTGGEPTIRRELTTVVAGAATIDGIEALAMTTNGVKLEKLALPLVAAGLHSVNVSMDSADPARFKTITRGGDLDRVIRGIEAAQHAGLTVKINGVLSASTTADDIRGVCTFAWGRGIVPRFIEQMPMSSGQLTTGYVSAATVRTIVAETFGTLVPLDRNDGDKGPAKYYLVGDTLTRLGLITPMSEHFCGSCNRARLTALGAFHPCLGDDGAISLRDLLRAGATDDEISAAVDAALGAKLPGHRFTEDDGAPRKHMVVIGG